MAGTFENLIALLRAWSHRRRTWATPALTKGRGLPAAQVGVTIEIGGAIQGQSAQYIDGVPNNVLGGNTIALVPTQDAIQEFSVVTSNAPADFGRFAGGVVNMTTKSGANAFHGSAYEYFRNADLMRTIFSATRRRSARPSLTKTSMAL